MQLRTLTTGGIGFLLTISAWAQDLPPTDNGTISIEELNIPQMGEPADAALSPAQEARIGADIVSQMYFYDYVLEDPELTDYMSSIGWRLAAASASKPPQLNVFVVKDPRINAFALPGGQIGFNAGLLIASGSESELAGVMSHELAHVTQRHTARSVNNAGGWESIATLGAMLAAVIAGSADPDVIMGAIAIGQGVTYQRQVSFTRSNELEADRIGIQTLSDAGFDPSGMSGFFQRLEQQSRLYGSGLPEILRTHPVNTTRISEARSRAANMPTVTHEDSIDYQLMVARTRVLVAGRPSEALEAFDAEMKSGQDLPGSRYGMALALSEVGQFAKAEEVLAPVIAEYPRQPNLNLLQASLLQNQGQIDKALALYATVLQTYSRYAPAILEYAEALIDAGQAAAARTVLLEHEQAFGTNIKTYWLLSRAAQAMNNDAEASYQMATYLYHHGDPGGALAQLDAGLRLASISSQDRAKLAARRSDLRQALPRDFSTEPNGRR